MKRLLFGSLTLAFVFSTFGVREVRAEDAGVLSGRVTLPEGPPAEGATVSVPALGRSARTAADGAFRFEAVPPGSYDLRAERRGYAPASARVAVEVGREETVTIALGPAVRFGEEVDVEGQGPRERSTALKGSAPLAETPYSVTVVPAERIEEQKAQSLNEVLRYVPGVQAEQYGGLDQAFDFLTVRGFGGPSFDGLFRDGAQLYTFGFTGFRVEPYGADSIEVLRGAASVLYGQTGPGGVVNVVSKLPSATPLGEATLEVGNFGHVQGKADLSGPLGGTAWRYRLTGLARNARTQVDSEENDRVFVAPALSWTGARSSATFLGHYQKDRAGHFQFLPQSGILDPNPNGAIPRTRADGEAAFDHFDREQYSAGYVVERRVGSRLTLRQHARFDHVDVDYADVFGTGLDPSDPAQRSLTRATFTILGDTDVLAADTQAALDACTGSLRHVLLLGVDYQRSTFESIDGFGDAPPLDVFAPRYGAAVVRPEPYADARTTRGQLGLYAQDRVHLPGGLVAVVAGRQNVVRSDIEDRVGASTTEEDADAFTWQGGLAWPNPSGLVPHASYSESFQPVAGLDANGQTYDPQTGRQYELGLRYAPKGRRASLAAAVFDLRRQHVLTADPANPANQVQTGEVSSRGLELEADVWVGPLRLAAAYTYQDLEITESNDGDQGLRPEAIPAHLSSLWAHYDVLGGRLGGLSFGGGVRFQGSTLDETNVFVVDGVTLVDAVASYRRGRVRLAVNAQNLLDEDYVAGCSFGSCYYGRARTLYGSVTVSR